MRKLLRLFPSSFLWVAMLSLTACVTNEYLQPGSSGKNKESENNPYLEHPDYKKFVESQAARFNKVAERRPVVYSELADYLVKRFDLEQQSGIGIDIGGGPGNLVFELAARTRKLYWINADINTWYNRYFSENALAQKLEHRTAFIYADACFLPFRSNYANIIVSRGSYQFWQDLEKGLTEINRVLKPGGAAFVGRGNAPAMPEKELRKLVKAGLIGGPAYNRAEDAERFHNIMEDMDIVDYEVILQDPAGESFKKYYGVWLYFRKN